MIITITKYNYRNYYDQPRQFQKLALSTELVGVKLTDLIEPLTSNGYKIFQADDRIYARKGIAGRIGPIIVHASMILILLGGIVGALTGFMAQELILSGNTFNITHLIQAGPFAHASQDWSVRVNRFWIDYDATGEIDQFYIDIGTTTRQPKSLYPSLNKMHYRTILGLGAYVRVL